MADQEEEEVPPLPPPIIPVPFSYTHPPFTTIIHNTIPPAINPPISTTARQTVPPVTHPPISTTACHTVPSVTHPSISTTACHTVPPVTHPPISTTARHTIPPVTHPPISTIARHTVPPVTHPPITTAHNTVSPVTYPTISTTTCYSNTIPPGIHPHSSYYPLSYSQLPSWLPPPPPPLYDDTMMTPPTDHDSYLVRELALLKERVARLEEKLTSAPSTEMMSNDTGIPDLNAEQMMVIGMISSNPSTGWKVALRKLLMVVFGEETLARSCCKGRKNATFQPLDGTKLNAVKGTLQYFNE